MHTSREHTQDPATFSLAARSQRLTAVIQEIKGLAERAGIEPNRIGYQESRIEEHGLVQESLVFGVEGSYGQFRQLVNLLEVSEDFLILDSVGLREASGSDLDVDLSISTLFAQPTSSDGEDAS